MTDRQCNFCGGIMTDQIEKDHGAHRQCWFENEAADQDRHEQERHEIEEHFRRHPHG